MVDRSLVLPIDLQRGRRVRIGSGARDDVRRTLLRGRWRRWRRTGSSVVRNEHGRRVGRLIARIVRRDQGDRVSASETPPQALGPQSQLSALGVVLDVRALALRLTGGYLDLGLSCVARRNAQTHVDEFSVRWLQSRLSGRHFDSRGWCQIDGEARRLFVLNEAGVIDQPELNGMCSALVYIEGINIVSPGPVVYPVLRVGNGGQVVLGAQRHLDRTDVCIAIG